MSKAVGKEVELGKGSFKFFAENFFFQTTPNFFFILHVKIAASLSTCHYDINDDFFFT